MLLLALTARSVHIAGDWPKGMIMDADELRDRLTAALLALALGFTAMLSAIDPARVRTGKVVCVADAALHALA